MTRSFPQLPLITPVALSHLSKNSQQVVPHHQADQVAQLVVDSMKRVSWLLCVAVSLLALSCASERDRVKKKKSFGGESIDVSQLNYFDLTSGKELNLARYMDENQTEYVLLIFGSVGCAKCNEKAKKISHNLVDSHSLFLNDRKQKFEMIGVNTDVGNAKKRFDQIWGDNDLRFKAGYSFVYWADPSATTVKDHLLDSGSSFAIPFMALLTKNSLLARYKADDPRDIATVLTDVENIMNGKAPQDPVPQPPVDEPKVPEVPEKPTIIFNKTLLVQKDRLKNEKVKSCQDGSQSVMGNALNEKFNFVHLLDDECDESCEHNQKVLNNYCEGQCGVMHLHSNSADCASNENFQTVNNLREDFSTLFNHEESLVQYNSWNEPFEIKRDRRSYVVGFDRSGHLVFAKAGKVAASDLQNISSSRWGPQISQVDFSLLGSASHATPPQKTSVPKVLSNAKYTVFYEYGPGCESCDKKLQKWSVRSEQTPGLLQFCEEKKGFCQVFALNVPIAGFQTADVAYTETLAHMKTKEVTVPLFVDADTISKIPGGDAYSRFFEGFLRPLYRKFWQDEFGGVLNGGTVIYDQDGKVIKQFAPDPSFDGKDKVSETLYSLWLYQ